MEENKQIYSYHTFLFPFLLKNGMTKELFCEKLDSTDSLWEKADMIVDNGKQLAAVESNELEEARLDYQTFQYFNPSARKALFEADSGIVSTYSLKHAKNGIYEVQYSGKTYPLNIDAIRLKVFNTGVAVIAFELEYWIDKGQEIQARQDIKIINEFGRRLYPEYLTTKDDAFLLCADRITVKLKEGKTVTTVLHDKAIIASEKAARDNAYLQDPIHLPEIITELTGVSEEDIEPAIDDRMFVCCCILDSKYADYFLGHDACPMTNGVEYWEWPKEQKAVYDNQFRQQPKWRFMTDWKAGCELYAMTNIDNSTPSCQNRIMLNQYFEEQLYLRWIEWGTIHAVTNHSLICLTGDPQYVMDSVVNPFLILYVPMCILGLAQRSSLLAYDAQITEAIKKAQPEEKPLEGRLVDDLIILAEQFAVFQGQLLLQEVTPQIQGVELYERIQKMLFIPSLEKNIQHQLNNLYQIAEANRAKQDNEKAQKMQGAFTAIAILAVASAWVDSYDFAQHIVTGKDFTLALWWSVLSVIILIVISIFNYWYQGITFRFIKKLRSFFRKKDKKGASKQ